MCQGAGEPLRVWVPHCDVEGIPVIAGFLTILGVKFKLFYLDPVNLCAPRHGQYPFSSFSHSCIIFCWAHASPSVCVCVCVIFFFSSFIFLATPGRMGDLSSPTRD